MRVSERMNDEMKSSAKASLRFDIVYFIKAVFAILLSQHLSAEPLMNGDRQ